MERITKTQLALLLKNGVVKNIDGNKWTILTDQRACDKAGIAYGYGNQETHKSNVACFKIKTSIFVARQFMRHRSFSYLEMSRRYTKGSKVPFEFWYPKDFPFDKELFSDDLYANYNNVLCQGIETQVASRFLPQTTYTEYYMMGEVEGLRNFFTLRCDKHAQAEIRELSFAMLELLEKHQPELYQKVSP